MLHLLEAARAAVAVDLISGGGVLSRSARQSRDRQHTFGFDIEDVVSHGSCGEELFGQDL
jgi:hypothetical protein